MHFARPDFFEAIVPDWVPDAQLANRVSGAAEVVLGLGMFHPRTRRASALGLAALTVIVFPANIDMAVNRVAVKPADGRMERHVGASTGPENWVRLPMQAPLLWWLLREARASA
jgi:uncharacterized membrane protein